MNDTLRGALARQYAAALQMLGNAIDACPEPLWFDGGRPHPFWYVVHHTLFWTDCYLSDSMEAYAPPAPFGLEELDPIGVRPPRPWTRDELRPWLAHCRRKASARIAALTAEAAAAPSGFPRLEIDRLELLLDNLRHAQHHVGQLQLMLRVHTGEEAPRYVTTVAERPA